MAEHAKCPSCGTELRSGTPSGRCPKCLIGLGMVAGEAAPSLGQDWHPRGPRRFGSYELKRQIGCGGMGVVYEAIEIDLNRAVALKLILDTQACSPVARRRFLIEAEAAARLDHPNIVPIYQVGEYEDQPFISMKLIHGETLRAKMDRGEFSLSKDGEGATGATLAERQKAVARLVAAVARAIHHAHTQNVIHRDLKPGNILIDAEGTPQVTDFGLAKILDGQHVTVTEPGAVQGTVPYMPPEQVRAERVSASADTYSLGVILYELLTGERPFRGATPIETMRLIEKNPPSEPRRLNKHISRDLQTICLKCLEKDPQNRYSSTADLATDLECWLRNEPLKARPHGPWIRTGRWVKRNPLGAGLIASLAFGLAAAIGLVFVVIKNAQTQGEEAERMRDATMQLLTMQTDELWRDPRRNTLVIPAEQIDILKLLPPRDAKNAIRLTFAVNIHDNPTVQALTFDPLIEHLRDAVSRALGSPVIFDLKFCKSPQGAFLEVAGTNADFQRLGAVSYLWAKQLSKGVQAVVQEDVGKEGVILVPTNSSIDNLSQLKGRSFAGADDSSTIGVWAKVHLVRAGVRREDLSDYQAFDEGFLLVERPHANGANTVATNQGNLASGATAVQEVLKDSLFWAEDFLELSNLVAKLRARSDPVSQFLWSQFSADTRGVLTNATTSPEMHLKVLKEELNKVLRGPSVFDAQRFAGVPLRTNTLSWKSRNPQGRDLIRLNRLLLEDAYPQEIAKRRHFDAAPLNRLNFDHKRYQGLTNIYSFISTPNVYVARAGLDPKILLAFQQAMVNISDSAFIKCLPLRPSVSRFLLPDERGLADLQAALTNEVKQFDGSASIPLPPVPSRP